MRRSTRMLGMGVVALGILGLGLYVPTAAAAKGGKKPKNACSKAATAPKGASGVNGSNAGMPGAEEEVKAFVDALTCPQPGVPGSISVLGIDLVLDDNTQFEDTTCDAIAALLTPGASVFAEIELVEDATTGALTATEVKLEQGDQGGQDDQGENEDGGGQGNDSD